MLLIAFLLCSVEQPSTVRGKLIRLYYALSLFTVAHAKVHFSINFLFNLCQLFRRVQPAILHCLAQLNTDILLD